MSVSQAHKFATAPTTGTFNGVAPGSRVNGATLKLGQLQFPKLESLSAKVAVLAETDTFAVSAVWQGSTDGASFVDLANTPWNTAAVPLATGTAGADSLTTIVIGAPESAYGYQYARMSLQASGTTGATQDTWSVNYQYVELA